MKSGSRFNVILALILGISASAFAAHAGEVSAVTASSIEGLWLRPIGGDGEAGGQGGKEGFYLHEGGSLELVGIASMNGLGWKVEGNELVLTTNTDRYTDPVPVKYTVENLTDKTLAIKADDYLSGSYEKDDPAVERRAQAMARHDGQALYRQRLRVHEIRGRERGSI